MCFEMLKMIFSPDGSGILFLVPAVTEGSKKRYSVQQDGK